MLTGEVDELSKQLTESKSALKEEEYLVPQKWETMTEYTQKSNKKAAKLNRLNDNCHQILCLLLQYLSPPLIELTAWQK